MIIFTVIVYIKQLITFSSFRMSYFFIFFLFKELYSLSQFLVSFCIFMDINSFLVCLASLHQCCCAFSCPAGMCMATCSHCCNEVYIAHHVDERFQ